MNETKGSVHPYKKQRVKYMGNINEMKEIQDMQSEYIDKLKAAFREVLTDVMNYWDNDPGHHGIFSRKAKEVYAEEIKLCGLEIDK